MVIINQLDALKEQTRKVLVEAKKSADLFDEFYGLAIYQLFEDGEQITWEQLNKVELNQYLDLPTVNGGSIKYIRKRNENENTMIYESIFSPDSILARHSHNCTEIIWIKEGIFDVVLTDKNNKEISHFKLQEGESVSIPKNTSHQFSNIGKDDAVIHIEYIKL